jgi:hypothetical protein
MVRGTASFIDRPRAGKCFLPAMSEAPPAPEEPSDPESTWTVADGVIRCAGLPAGCLRTHATYRDYVLRFEWRWTGAPGNSGCFVHLTEPDKVWPQCLEIQLRATDARSVRMNGGASVNEVRPPAPNARQVTRRTADTEKPPGEWNQAEVVCRGDSVTVTINGVLQTEVTGSTLADGAIALQSEGAPTEFRAIEMAPLPAMDGR